MQEGLLHPESTMWPAAIQGREAIMSWMAPYTSKYASHWTEKMLSKMAALGQHIQCARIYGNNGFQDHMLHRVMGMTNYA